MIDGLLHALEPLYLLLLVGGAAAGIVVGAMPGLNATMALALMIPLTAGMDPIPALVLMGGLYVGAMYGDAIPACLINVPGTPAAVATAFDGYPLTLRGEGNRALVAACFSSMIGAFIGGFALLFISPPLARFSLQFGPPEFFWLGVLSLTIIGSLAGKSFLKGIGAGLIGLLISTVGLSTAGGTSRYTLGFTEVTAGINLVPALIGLFAIPQLIGMLRPSDGEEKEAAGVASARSVLRSTVGRALRRPANLVRSGAIGTVVGILPGAGGSVASLMSYNEARRWSKNKDEFGNGAVEGVVASETANNAAATSSLIPLLTLGIPGSAAAAVVMGALLLHGITPGGELFVGNPDLVYTFSWAMVIAGFAVFGLGLVMSRYLVKIVELPPHVLVLGIGVLASVGSFSLRSNVFDVGVMLAIGVAGYFLTRLQFPLAPIALGLILGPIVERGLDTSLRMTRGSTVLDIFLLRPISIGLIALSIVSLISLVWTRRNMPSVAVTTTTSETEDRGTHAS